MTARYTLRIDEEDMDKVRKAAEQDKRSVNQQVQWYIKQGLERSEIMLAQGRQSGIAETVTAG